VKQDVLAPIKLGGNVMEIAPAKHKRFKLISMQQELKFFNREKPLNIVNSAIFISANCQSSLRTIFCRVLQKNANPSNLWEIQQVLFQLI